MFISCVKILTKCYEVNILRNKKSNKKKRKEMLGSTAWLPMSVREHHLRRLLLLLFGALVHAEKGNETKAVCITCVACVCPSARSGRKSSARIPASARAYDWICACSVWSGSERVGRDQIPVVPNKSNPSDPLIERINLTSPNRRRSLTLLSYSDLLSLHQFFFERF